MSLIYLLVWRESFHAIQAGFGGVWCGGAWGVAWGGAWGMRWVVRGVLQWCVICWGCVGCCVGSDASSPPSPTNHIAALFRKKAKDVPGYCYCICYSLKTHRRAYIGQVTQCQISRRVVFRLSKSITARFRILVLLSKNCVILLWLSWSTDRFLR
jgi:hypothetical protein